MSKRRIKNNFKKWVTKSFPFFLIVFFIFFNVSFFVYNSASHEKKLMQQQLGSMKKLSHEASFSFVLDVPERENLKEMLEIYKMENDGYPTRLDEIAGVKNKNWLYTKSVDRYILEYKK